jgi:sugar phosphate isomerase/epimerase
LELASENPKRRAESLQLARDICHQTALLDPAYYILHIPFTRPTLVPVPGLYFKAADPRIGDDWTRRALDSLEELLGAVTESATVLVENINYAPSFLEAFIDEKRCGLCLDLGHLMLGGENVIDRMLRYLPVTSEIHLHGVQGQCDHVSVALLPAELVRECMRCLKRQSYSGLLNLEVFSPDDLTTSLDCIKKALRKL